MRQISHPAATADHSAFDMLLALVKLLSDPAQLAADIAALEHATSTHREAAASGARAVAAAQESARAILAGAQAEADTIRAAARAKLDKASALLAALGPAGEGESA
jgi:cell division septum initiation protein DivIVA